jgi:hypothetical protein
MYHHQELSERKKSTRVKKEAEKYGKKSWSSSPKRRLPPANQKPSPGIDLHPGSISSISHACYETRCIGCVLKTKTSCVRQHPANIYLLNVQTTPATPYGWTHLQLCKDLPALRRPSSQIFSTRYVLKDLHRARLIARSHPALDTRLRTTSISTTCRFGTAFMKSKKRRTSPPSTGKGIYAKIFLS